MVIVDKFALVLVYAIQILSVLLSNHRGGDEEAMSLVLLRGGFKEGEGVLMFAKVLIATIATSAIGVHIDRSSRFSSRFLIEKCEGTLDDVESDKYFTMAVDVFD